jgi:LuxR family maltose regulon positive regulatory protein
MSTPILTTKLCAPSVRPDWVLRSRLIKRLDLGAQNKLTLISAPAGFGKTTLIASWLHGLADRQHHKPRVAWLSLERDDNDPVRFITYFIAGLQRIDPGMGQTARSYLSTPHLPDLNHIMTLVINDLDILTEPVVLVLDDYHVIKHPDLQSSIAFFLEHLPRHCHLVIATREEPSLPLPRLRVRSEVVEIRLQDLRFTTEETSLFLRRTMGLDLTGEAARALEDCTEGWAAGLQMAALSLRGRERTEDGAQPIWEIKALGAHRDIIDYLAAEVMRRQPSDVRTFLNQTSLLDRFNASLCDAVTERSDAQAMLIQLEKANLFLIPLDERREWYRYHHIFADFLRRELAEPQRIALHSRAGRWCESHGLTEEAIKHALAARDYEAVVRLIRSGAEEWSRNGGFNTLLDWINALPESVVRAHTDLLVRKAWILHLRGEVAAGESYGALAVEHQRPDDAPLHRGMLLSFRAYLAIHRGEPAKAVKLAQESLALLGDTESYYRTGALFHLGHAQHLVGDQRAAIQTLRQAIALGQRLGHHLISLVALGYLMQFLNQQGQLREAILMCEQASARHLDERGRPLPMAGLIYAAVGMLYYETNDIERADHYLSTGITLCRQMGMILPALVGQCTLARLQYARGETEAAWDTLAAARHLAVRSEHRRLARMVAVTTAGLQLRQGYVAAAELTLADLLVASDRSEQEDLICARLLLAQGKAQSARELLQPLEQSARNQGRRGSLIAIHLLQALVHQHLNCTTAALDSLEQAICLAATEGYYRIFLDEAPAIATLLPQQKHTAPDFVASLLEYFSSTPTDKKAAAARLPLVERLSETQLTVLRLVADGLSNRGIASELAIAESTTKWHLGQIYSKLNVYSRTQAVARARQLNLL